MPFSSLGLASKQLRAVTAQGYTTPTPIQAQAIPVILDGRDLLASAQTGTGKTAAFILPLLQRLQTEQRKKYRHPRALVLTPTRELAVQVANSVRIYGRYALPRTAVLVGGLSMRPQCDALRRGVDLLIATPGRLLDHVQQRTVDLSHVEMLVLDEADRMLDMGFMPAIRQVLMLLSQQRQNLLFSATFPDGIRKLAGELLNDPVTIDIAPRNATADHVEHRVHPVDPGRKAELLSHLLRDQADGQALVFTRTRHGADRLARQLEREGFHTAALHGDKTQAARSRALAAFKKGRINVLVATDVAARGLDIAQLPLVVNYELPHVPEDYVHRIGRTGRAGCAGIAFSLVCAEEVLRLQAIQRLLGRTIPSVVIDGFEPTAVVRTAAPRSARKPKKPRSGQFAHRSSHSSRQPADTHHSNRPGGQRRKSKKMVKGDRA